MNESIPIFAQIENKSITVFGSDGSEKVAFLAERGANITWIIEKSLSSTHINSINNKIERKVITERPATNLIEQWIQKSFIVYAFPDWDNGPGPFRSELFHIAEKSARWFCSIDDTNHCNFINPAFAENKQLKLAVSTSGLSPTLAGMIRHSAGEIFLSDNMLKLGLAMQRYRPLVARSISDLSRRKYFWQEITENNDFLEAVFNENEATIKAIIQNALHEREDQPSYSEAI